MMSTSQTRYTAALLSGGRVGNPLVMACNQCR